MRKILLRIIRELNPTIFLIEKLSFPLKLLSGFFYGQSFIKTVRGPLTKLNIKLFHICLYHCKDRTLNFLVITYKTMAT